MFAMDMKEDLKIFSHRRAARDGFGGWRLEELEEGINLGDLEKKLRGKLRLTGFFPSKQLAEPS